MALIDFTRINQAALARLRALLPAWLPGGRVEGREYVALNPRRGDAHFGSFKVNLDKGIWHDFASGDGGSDPIALRAFIDDVAMGEAALRVGRELGLIDAGPPGRSPAGRPPAKGAGSPGRGGAPTKPPPKNAAAWRPDVWRAILPVPDDAPLPLDGMIRLGGAVKQWTYRDAAGRVLGLAARFNEPPRDGKPGGKQFSVQTYCQCVEQGSAVDRDGRPRKVPDLDAREWRWQSWATPRPLYGLELLARRPDAPVVVAEGEKAADAAGELLPHAVAVASPNGAAAAHVADWTVLAGRDVVIWPDADIAGRRYARVVAFLLHRVDVRAVSVVNPLLMVPDPAPGWDAADAAEEGWDRERAHRLAAMATAIAAPSTTGGGWPLDPAERRGGSGQTFRVIDGGASGETAGGAGGDAEARAGDGAGQGGQDGEGTGGKRRKRVSVSDLVASLLAGEADGVDEADAVELWRDKLGAYYASVPRPLGGEDGGASEDGGGRDGEGDGGEWYVEHLPLKSAEFGAWLRVRARARGIGFLGADMVEAIRHEAASIAWERRTVHQTWRRIAPGPIGADGKRTVYLDLGDASRRVVQIRPDGWGLVRRPRVKLLRASYMTALPVPERGGSIDGLRELLHLATEGDFRLAVAWLLGALLPSGPYPVLFVNGPQGSGKSDVSALLGRLIDPKAIPHRSAPREERDLMIAASNAHSLVFDNLSSVPDWLSDALCRLSLGGGYATRELRSDNAEIVMLGCSPIILNGIPDIVRRGDLADRTMTVTTAPFGDGERRTRAALEMQFRAAWPELLGALLDGVRSALDRRDTVEIKQDVRMADFARWATAAEPGLGWRDGTVLDAFHHARQQANLVIMDGEPALQALRALAIDKKLWRGRARDLLTKLGEYASDEVRRLRRWPTAPNHLSGLLQRSLDVLRAAGVAASVDWLGSGADKRREWLIEWIGAATADQPAAAPAPGRAGHDVGDYPDDDPGDLPPF